MRQSAVLTDFTAGELSEKLSGRFDLAVYAKGASLLENFMPFSQGGITYRPGTAYLGRTKLDARARLVPFIIAQELAYIVEFTPGYIRFWHDDALIESVSGTVLEIASPYTTDDMIRELQVTQIGDRLYIVHKLAAPRYLRIVSSDLFILQTIAFTAMAEDELPFQSAGNYPGAVAAYAGRVFFAGSVNEPCKIWASKPFDYDSFSYYDEITSSSASLSDPETWADPTEPEYETTETTREVTGAGHAFSLELASDQNDHILWMAAGRELVVGTISGEWVLPYDITAINLSARLQTRYGSAAIQGRLVGDSVVFVQASRCRLREYYYQNEQGAYQSPDLTFLADHVLGSGIVDLDYTTIPEPTILATRDDGVLAMLLYNKTHGAVAWSRQVFASGEVESVAAVPDSDGVDAVYLAIKRGGTRCIEKLERPFSGGHLDSAITVTRSGSNLSGLERFSGATVWIDWSAGPTVATVVEGVMAWPAAIPAGTTCRIGLPIHAQARTMRFSTQTSEGIGQGKLKRIVGVVFRLLSSGRFKAGYANETTALRAIQLPEEPFTGDVEDSFSGRWDRDGWVAVDHESLDDLTILTIIPEVDS